MSLSELINEEVDRLCIMKCGVIPTHSSMCKGYSNTPPKCTECDGGYKVSTMMHRSGRNWTPREVKYKCNSCNGTGRLSTKYTCEVRLLSDNSAYAAQMRWNNKLRNQLEKLQIMSKKYKKEIIGVEKNENNSVHNIG